jgi:hypothetical protein
LQQGRNGIRHGRGNGWNNSSNTGSHKTATLRMVAKTCCKSETKKTLLVGTQARCEFIAFQYSGWHLNFLNPRAAHVKIHKIGLIAASEVNDVAVVSVSVPRRNLPVTADSSSRPQSSPSKYLDLT